jgi:hypothetical protein
MEPFLVERMTLAPGTCMKCGAGNTPDGDTGKIGPFIDLAMDYNYGDSGYFCIPCAEKVGVLAGLISADTAKDLERKIKAKDEAIHELQAEIEQRRNRMRQLKRRADAAEVLSS